MLLHRERGLGCALRLSMEIQPLGCCFVGCVLRLRLLVASVAGSLAGGRDEAFLTLDLVVCCSSTSGSEIEFWRPGTLCWSPVPSTLQRLENLSVFLGFRGYGSGFLPPTAGRSFIGGTSACSDSLLRLTAVSPQPSGWRLRSSAGSCAGIDGRLSSPPSGVADGAVSCTLDALCIDRFSGQSWSILDFLVCEFLAGLCRYSLA